MVTNVPEAESVLYQGAFVSGEGYARHAANAFMAFQLGRPLVWVQIALPLILIPLLSTALGSHPFSLPIALGVDVVIIVANVISWVTRRRRLIYQLSNSAIAGARRELSMTESTISIQTGDALAQSPYRQFESAETHGDFVFIRVRGSSIRSIVPRELFTEESLAFLRAKIA
jgi:hypothetical protein